MQIVQTTPQNAHTPADSNQNKPDAAHPVRSKYLWCLVTDEWRWQQCAYLSWYYERAEPVEKAKTMFLPFDMS